MRMLSLISTLLVVGNIAVTAWGADLTKIDRTIAKEPAYRSKPKYCLLVFGPEAKTRVWLVLDGDTLYVDRNGNGDLTEERERLVLAQDEYDRKRGRRVWVGLSCWQQGRSALDFLSQLLRGKPVALARPPDAVAPISPRASLFGGINPLSSRFACGPRS
jgi:hypothetical protein